MNPEDYAIIIGLQNYPGLRSLQGPENDARAFHEWIVSPTDGGVPNNKQHVRLILSSQYKPKSTDVGDARPVVRQIQQVFKGLLAIHRQNINKGRGPRIGRRLYIYMAGHGISPRGFDGVNQHESALLTSNYNPETGRVYHVPGAYTATWFSLNDCFDEVFLFMDCCRDDTFVRSVGAYLDNTGTADRAKRCYAFGTKWSQRSREKSMADEKGAVRGIFTKTLLAGLRGAAAHPDPANAQQSIVTVSTLKGYLYENMKRMASATRQPDESGEIRSNLTITSDFDTQEPEVDYWPRTQEGRDILIKTLPMVAIFPVRVVPQTGQSGRVQINRNFNNRSSRVTSNDQFDADWFIRLPRGMYYATFEGNGQFLEANFEVAGIEGVGGVPVTQVEFK